MSVSKLYLQKSLNLAVKPWLLVNEFALDRVLVNVPEHYKKFYWEWKYGPRTPVHYIPNPNKFEKLENGEV